MIGKAPTVDPVTPEATGLGSARVDLGPTGGSGRVGPTEHSEGRLAFGETVTGANGAALDAKAHVAGEGQVRKVPDLVVRTCFVGRAVLVLLHSASTRP